MSKDTWKLVEERCVLKVKLEAVKTRKQKLAATNMYNKKNRGEETLQEGQLRGGELMKLHKKQR